MVINKLIAFIIFGSYTSVVFAQDYYYYQNGKKTPVYIVSEKVVVEDTKNTDEEVTRYKIIKRSAAVKATKTYPVFLINPGTTMYKTIPGGVAVKFKRKLTDNELIVFMKKYNLKITTTVFTGKNVIYKFSGEPGLASLELANHLATDNDVKSSEPDWYRGDLKAK